MKFALSFIFSFSFFVDAGDACPNYCWQLLQRSVGLRLRDTREHCARTSEPSCTQRYTLGTHRQF